MNMKFVTKLVLIPITEWKKVKKHLPQKNILNTVEVDQMPPVKQEAAMTNFGLKETTAEEEHSLFKSDGTEEEERNFND